MWRAVRPFPVLPVAIAAILLLLAGLATLQYRWAGELSAAEHARLKAMATTRAEAFGRDFDTEITRAFRLLEMDRDTVRARDHLAWVARFEAWQRSSSWPGLVKEVYLAERGAAGDLAKYDPARRTFEPVEWSGALQGFRRRLQPQPGERRPPPLEPILEDPPALVMMAWDRGPRSPGPGPGPRGDADVPAVIALLDQDAIRDRMLPTLADKHFGGPGGLDHDLRIVRQRDRGTTVWASASVPDLARVDAAAGLFELRSAAPSTAPRGGGPGFPSRAYGVDSGRWRLEVANRAGPLDGVVATARRRNLAVGFGVLALLMAAVWLVVATARRAQRLAERQMQFVAAVSHELRTPLAVIQSTSENLADGVVKDPARIRTYGEVILDQSRRLGGMIEDVLAFAGATARERTRRDDELDPGALVDEVLAALAATLRTRNVVLERQVPDELPAVRGDAGLLRRAFRNLVENAVKHGGDAPGVAVRLAEDRAAGQVVLTVEDHGPGIDPPDLPHLFDPFYRGRDAQARQVPGFGLGLALVKRTIEEHGGRVSVESTPGQGSTFTLRLPIAPTAPVAARAAVDGLPNPSH